MDRALAQSTYLSSLVSVPRHGQIKGYEKTSPRTVRMICNMQVSPLRMVCFPGKGDSNALGTMVRPGLDFHSKAGPMISYRRRKSARFVPKARFERFTGKAIKVILLAQEETKLLGHNFVGTEQILLGLIGEGTGIAANVLESMGINLKEARIEVEKIIGRGSGFVSREIQFTLHAKRVLEISLEEARQLGHSYIGSEHLLLGLLREGEGVAAKVLEILGADPSTIRTQVLESVGAGFDFPYEAGPMISYRQRKSTRFVPKARFERFTEKAIKVMMLAREETKRLGHNFAGTEQILLGLIGEGTGIAANVLKSMGINLKEARIEVEKIIGRGSGFVSREIPFTPPAKRVLELSLEEARQLGHSYVGSEHLLLGLLRVREGVAAKILENLGADPSTIRTQASLSNDRKKLRTSLRNVRNLMKEAANIGGKVRLSAPPSER